MALRDSLKQLRSNLGGVLSNKFSKERCKQVNSIAEVTENCAAIVYWMQRDVRVDDNWALLFAQKLALKNQVALHVCYFIRPEVLNQPTPRQYKFLLASLRSIKPDLNKLGVQFHLINSSADESLPDIISRNNVGALICDFSPLRQHRRSVEAINEKIKVAFIEVDAHNVVPCWEASAKQEHAARTLRPKIHAKLAEYLVEFPEVVKHPHTGELSVDEIALEEVWDTNKNYFTTYLDSPDTEFKPGADAAYATLEDFLENKLQHYETLRNEPSKDAQSNLSPYLHFGLISAQRCALEAKKSEKKSASFLEELIVRKELADNFCFYNPNYDSVSGADEWAIKTLQRHAEDERKYVYTEEQLLDAKTHDPYWNAAQKQLNAEGKMHGYMRMYWCKKILEWTKSPEDAVRIALGLNDALSLDGSDPNGFVGVMWSICGVHDHGWTERPIFGKIRYMVDYSLAKKFDLATYCAKYGEKIKKTK